MQVVGRNFFFGAPTREQTKRIAWNDLKLFAEPVLKSKSETELWVELTTGSKIWCVGFDRPERFDGTPWHGGIVDEYGDMAEEVWPEHIYPALMDTGGWCWLIGVPAGRNHYFELSEYARSGDPDWEDYCWFSEDVLDPKEIDAARRTLDERTYRQELQGSFESYEGRAFPYYDSHVHRLPSHFVSNRSLCVACDFNLDPCIWVLGQDMGGTIVGLDEIVQHRTDIWKMCAELSKRAERYGAKQLVFYGDFQHGKSRSVSAIASSWHIIREQFPNADFRIRPNPRILDGVNAVNAKLRNTRGEVQFRLDPKCMESHKDFEQCGLQDIMDRTEGKDRGHASSCFRYWVHYEYPVVRGAELTVQ